MIVYHHGTRICSQHLGCTAGSGNTRSGSVGRGCRGTNRGVSSSTSAMGSWAFGTESTYTKQQQRRKNTRPRRRGFSGPTLSRPWHGPGGLLLRGVCARVRTNPRTDARGSLQPAPTCVVHVAGSRTPYETGVWADSRRSCGCRSVLRRWNLSSRGVATILSPAANHRR